MYPKNPDDELAAKPETEMVWTVGRPGSEYDSREIKRSREYRLVVVQGDPSRPGPGLG